MGKPEHCCAEIEPGTIVKILGQPRKLLQSVFCIVPETFLDDNDIMAEIELWPDQLGVGS